MTTKVVTGKVRFSYLNWAAPKKNDLSGKMEYSTQLLVPKSDTETVAKCRAAIKAAIEKKWGGKPPANWRNPLRDGDTETKEDGSALGAEYKGHYFINIRSDQKPGIVDASRQPILEADEFISGDYGRASMNAYAYDQKGNKGVSFGWNNAQMLEKGEPLSGRARAEDDFDDEPSGKSVAADDADF